MFSITALKFWAVYTAWRWYLCAELLFVPEKWSHNLRAFLKLVKAQVIKVLFKPCRVWILTKDDTKFTTCSILLLRVNQAIVEVEPAMLKAPLLFSKLNRWKAMRSRRDKVLGQYVVCSCLVRGHSHFSSTTWPISLDRTAGWKAVSFSSVKLIEIGIEVPRFHIRCRLRWILHVAHADVRVSNCSSTPHSILQASQAFIAATKEGPDYTCVCCNRLMYRKTVIEFKINKYSKAPEEFTVANSGTKQWICKTCDHWSGESCQLKLRPTIWSLKVYHPSCQT